MIIHASSLSAKGFPSTGANIDKEVTKQTRETREVSQKIPKPIDSQPVERAYLEKFRRIDIYA